jgi:hypothetical protein
MSSNRARSNRFWTQRNSHSNNSTTSCNQ